MKRGGYHFFGRAHLDEFPQIHHPDSMRHMPQDRHAVRRQQVGHAELLLKVQEEIQDLRLHGDIERRHRLIGDDETGLQGQRPRHGNPLALPAAELVRIAAQRIPGQADRLHQFRGFFFHTLRLAVNYERLSQDFADSHAGIERGEGVLKDDLHLAAPPAQRFNQAQNAAAQRGLAATRLPRQAKNLTPPKRQTDPIHGPNVELRLEPSSGHGKILPHLPHFDQRRRGRFFGCSCRVGFQSGTNLAPTPGGGKTSLKKVRTIPWGRPFQAANELISHYPRGPRVRSRSKAALISARWVNACGKFPRASPAEPVSSE